MITRKGIISATGEHDSGKTRFLLETTPIHRIAFFHDDTKKPPRTDKIGLFVDLMKDCRDMKMMEWGQYVVKRIEAIKPGEYDAIIFDTWTRTEQALRYWGKAHAEQFREVETFAVMGSMKNGEKWKEGDRYVAKIINDMANKVGMVGLACHLKDENKAGVKTGKMIPDASKTLDTVCNFRVWLRKNPNSGVPIALVLKRLAEDTLDENGFIRTINIMPWKITPRPEDGSLWDTIDYYRANPYGNRQPTPEETPDLFELSCLTSIMTPTQQQIWQANLREKELMDKEEFELVSQEEQAISEFIHSLNGTPLPVIKSKLESQAKEAGWSQQEFSLGWIAQVIAS